MIPSATVAINATGTITTSLAYQNIGVTLDVTPSLIGTDKILLQIMIEESQRVGDAVTLDTGAGLVDTPIMSTRKATTEVLLRPDQAVILGGLISERHTEKEQGVPILKDIPILGYLFKSKVTQKEEATLMFFIRPRILGGTDLTQDF